MRSQHAHSDYSKNQPLNNSGRPFDPFQIGIMDENSLVHFKNSVGLQWSSETCTTVIGRVPSALIVLE